HQYRVISVGFELLHATTLTGNVFAEETFGRPLPLNHKTVLSLIATVFFGLLLAGRWLWGWRGRIAIRLTLGGFVLLLLSYVGSRFVLEVILKRI
ncbi:MAG: cytochrome c biogenesis protein CcsA, partial [Lautropia sp.]